jgi:hypothetical protein
MERWLASVGARDLLAEHNPGAEGQRAPAARGLAAVISPALTGTVRRCDLE